MAKFGRNGAGPARPPAPGALDRVKALEQFREEILRAVRSTFAAVEQRLQNLEEISEALVNLSGRAQVEEEVKRLHIERVEAKSAIEQKALDAALSTGKIKEAEVVGELSVIVGSEVDKDGNKLYPSRVQMLFATLLKEYQEKLRGAKVGDVIETPFGSKFTVQIVYDIVPPDQQPQPSPAAQLDAPVPEGAKLPDVAITPLDEETEAKMVEDLAEIAELLEREEAAVEEQLVEDLAGQTAKIVPQPN
jgi:hypothetical protein